MLYLIPRLDRDYEGPVLIISGCLQIQSVSVADVASLLLGHGSYLESRYDYTDVVLPIKNIAQQAKHNL